MISSFYTAATGAIQLQKGVDVIANNVANVSTTGYKASESSFADLLYTNIKDPAGTDTDLKSGHGTRLNKTDTVFTQGALQDTGRSLDYALTQPNQFFAVEKNGQVQYTRSGDFHLSVENGTNYLVASDGAYVLNNNGERVAVANEQDAAPVGVFSFQNCDGLVRQGDTRFSAAAASGPAAPVAGAQAKQGWLEDSSVSVADEMVNVLEKQRAFQMNSKIVQLSDEIMQTVNALR
jgi:flagellar basal-body rod protein FlgG